MLEVRKRVFTKGSVSVFRSFSFVLVLDFGSDYSEIAVELDLGFDLVVGLDFDSDFASGTDADSERQSRNLEEVRSMVVAGHE